MIRLNDYSAAFITSYIDKISKQVYDEASLNLGFWQTNFPESFSTTLKKDFFDDILKIKLPDLFLKYPSVKNYFNTVFFSTLIWDRVKKEDEPRAERKLQREYYVNTYIDGNPIALRHLSSSGMTKNDLIQNATNFNKFRSYLHRNFIAIVNPKIAPVFNYGKYISQDIRAAIITDLNIAVCPYCNRQYINNFEINGSPRPAGDIDHFYYKDAFALFGLSLYNFVPSCKICNSLFKRNINSDIVYPYTITADSYMDFSIKESGSHSPITPGALIGWHSDLSIELEPNISGVSIDGVNRGKTLFHLEDQYAIHKEYVRDFLYKKNVISGSVMSHIKKFLAKHSISLSDDELNEMIYGFDLDHINLLEKPLAKLTKDLYEKY